MNAIKRGTMDGAYSSQLVMGLLAFGFAGTELAQRLGLVEQDTVQGLYYFWIFALSMPTFVFAVVWVGFFPWVVVRALQGQLRDDAIVGLYVAALLLLFVSFLESLLGEITVLLYATLWGGAAAFLGFRWFAVQRQKWASPK